MWAKFGMTTLACALLSASLSGCGESAAQKNAQILKEQEAFLEALKASTEAKAKTIAEDNRRISEDKALSEDEKKQAISVNQEELRMAESEYAAAKAQSKPQEKATPAKSDK